MRKNKDNLFFTIRDRIYSGYYWPREKLVETKLAEEMDVSRTVIRDVLKALAAKDLVNIEPHKGAFVAEISYQKMRELVELEAFLEGAAAFRATNHLSADQIKHLHTVIAQSKDIEEPKTWSAYNRKFHKIIITTCGNEKLIDIIRDNVIFLKYWFIQLSTQEEIDQRNDAHLKILSAIESKKPKLARTLMEQHVIDSLSSLLKRIQASNPNLVSLDHKMDFQKKDRR